MKDLLDTISSQAMNESEKIRNDTGRFVEKQINDAEKEALAESYAAIRYSAAKIRSETGAALTKKRIETEQQLLLRRNNIKQAVFEKAAEKIRQFTLSDAYPDFLKASFKKCCETIGGDSFTVEIRAEDAELLGDPGAFPYRIEFHFENSIVLGGIRVTGGDGRLTADDTLDVRLTSQYKWFYKNSGLTIRRNIG